MKRLWNVLFVVILMLTLVASLVPVAFAGAPAYQVTVMGVESVAPDAVIEVFNGPGAATTSWWEYEGSSCHLGDYPPGYDLLKMHLELDQVMAFVAWDPVDGSWALLGLIAALGGPSAVVPGYGHLSIWFQGDSFAITSVQGEPNFVYLNATDAMAAILAATYDPIHASPEDGLKNAIMDRARQLIS